MRNKYFKALSCMVFVTSVLLGLAWCSSMLIPKMAVGEQILWHLLPMGIVPLIISL